MSQIKNKFIEAATGSTVTGVTGDKLRLNNNQALRARNAANSADVNILLVNASNVITMQGALSMNSNQINNVTDPSIAQDAATKNYVDTQIPATSANRALSNLASVAINTALLPGADGTIDLGSIATGFRSGFLRNLKDTGGAIAVDVSNRSLDDTSGNQLLSFATTHKLVVLNGNTLTFADTGSNVVNIQSPTTITASYTLTLPTAQGGANTFLQNNGSGALSWASAGTGSVTSVAFSDTSTTPIYNISGSPITTSGTISQTLSNQAVNTVFAGPSSGGSTQPTFRLLVASDIPTISLTTGVSGILPIANGGTGANSTSQNFAFIGPTSGSGAPSFRALVAGDIPSLSSLYLPLTGGTMSGVINMGSNKITNLTDPTNPQDASTKNYVDTVAQGVSWKNPVLVVSTSNITLSGEQTIDGVTTSASRVLVQNQSTASQNGIYVSASGAWSRSSDANTGANLVSAAVFVEEGTANANTAWVQTSAPPITIGTTSILFVKFASSTPYTFRNGLTQTGQNVDVTPGDNSLTSTIGNLVVKLNAAGAIITSVTGLQVQVESTTEKINGSNQIEGLKPISENSTLSSGDITNQFKDLSHAIYGQSASVNSAQLSVVGGPVQQKTVDYTVSLTGGSGGVTRITFAGDLATGGNAALVSGDILMVNYSYL